MNANKFMALARSKMENEICGLIDIIHFYIWTQDIENTSVVTASDELKLVRDIPVEYFLKVILPGFVLNVKDYISTFKKTYGDDVEGLLRTAIRLKSVFQKAKKRKVDCASLDVLYDIYEETATRDKKRIEKDGFLALYKAVNLYVLDTNELKPECIGYDIKDLHRVIKIVKELQLPRSGRISLAHNVYNLSSRAVDVLDDYAIYNFVIEKDANVRRRLITEAELAIAKMPPLDVLCELMISKGLTNKGPSGKSEHYYLPNDVALENSLCYEHFVSMAGSSDVNKVAVFLPSPFFIKKMMRDRFLQGKDILFVLENEKICEIIKLHYEEGSYESAVNKATFISFASWLESIDKGEIEADFQTALYFGCGEKSSSMEMDKWLEILTKNVETPIGVYALLRSELLEKQDSAVLNQIKDIRIWVQNILLLPQNIRNSSAPHRKILLKLWIHPNGWTGEEKTTLYGYELNHDFKKQALAAKLGGPAVVGRAEITSGTSTIRHLLYEKTREKNDTGARREKSEKYSFTPDLNIWFTETKQSSGIRITAYMCDITPEGRVERGFRDKGNLIQATKKITTKVSSEGLNEWLEYIYPFSEIRPRSAGNISELMPKVSVRESLIEALGSSWRGQNLALKTVWYALPNMEEILKAADYELLSETVRSAIGNIRVLDIVGEAMEQELIRCFPSAPQETLLKRFKMLSILIDEAIKKRYVEKNPLADILRDQRKYDKLFGQVRKAMTKKHFTEHHELLMAYTIIRDKLEAGDERYLGLLIRFLYGLEPNVVCGLRCGDVYQNTEYHLLKINIMRQVTNDGKRHIGFDNIEDYRWIPCTPMLKGYIERRLSDLEAKYGKEIMGKMPLIPDESGDGALTPQVLSGLCREVISDLNFDPRIISIPTIDGGRKETNLNDYGGDFFRENFKFWTRTTGLLDDELAYVMGNKAKTTLGRHYIDLGNDASLKIIENKINRWHSMLEHSGRDFCREIIINEGSNRFQLDSKKLMELNLRIKLKRGISKIHIVSSYGMAVNIEPIETLDSKEKKGNIIC